MNNLKKLTFLILIILNSVSFAQIKSEAYETQRAKINNMLQERSNNFGTYTESLTQRTGIFGLKIKKDMQRSNDILVKIVTTDNDIFKQLKVLLDFKDLQQTEVIGKSEESENRSKAYMLTINKLREENIKIQDQVKDLKKTKRFYQGFMYAFIITVIAVAVFLFRKIFTK